MNTISPLWLSIYKFLNRVFCSKHFLTKNSNFSSRECSSLKKADNVLIKRATSQSFPQPICLWNFLQKFKKKVIDYLLLVRVSTFQKLLVVIFMFITKIKQTATNSILFLDPFFPRKNSYNKECFWHCPKKIFFFC